MSHAETTPTTALTPTETADYLMACILLAAEARAVIRTWSRLRLEYAKQMPSKLAVFGRQQANIAHGVISACEGAATDPNLDPAKARDLIQQVAARNPMWTPASTPAPASDSEPAQPTTTQEAP